MELLTDKGNIESLKILISSNIAKRKLTLKHVKLNDVVNTGTGLPVLVTSASHQLFSSNAAVRYLLSGRIQTADSEALTDTWLEWEAVQLRSLVHRLVVASKAQEEKSLVAEIKTQLSCLERLISEHEQNGLSMVLEVVVWCSVFPIFTSTSPHRAVLASDAPRLLAWFDRKLSEDSYSRAVSQLMDSDVWTSIKTSFSAQPAPYSVDSCKQKMKDLSLSQRSSKNPEDKDTESSACGEAVTSEELARATEAWLHGASDAPKPLNLSHPILPEAGQRNVLITSALPYVNNVPHLGNIIGCVLSADVFARFSRLCNHRTLYICGTDEYGTATETKAVEEGLTPQQICDKYHALHADIYSWFNISFDHFGRTTTQQQTECAQDIFWRLHSRGYISTDSVEQLQCVQCNRFLADRFVEGTCPFCSYEDARGDQCDKCGKLINAIELGAPRCKLCKSRPIVRSSQHLFLDLPKLEPLLVRHLDENFERGVWSSNTKVITRSWIRDGLHNRCITRDLKWGTPVPMERFTDKVFYVWYDAPIGYVSITANYTDQWRRWWKNPDQVELYQFMAKDNVPFHSVIFPSCQLGTGEPYTIVNHLSATEYLNYEDGKFSKSRGVGVFGNDAKDTGIPADIWRFYLLFMRPENQDSAFSWDDFLLKNNSELLNNLGNFINRGLTFISNNFGGRVPEVTLTGEDRELLALVTREVQAYTANLQRTRLRDGIRNILSISRLGNQYMQSNAPWVLVKGSPSEKERAGSVVGLAANLACLLSVLVQPYMPTISTTIQTQLAAPPHVNVITQTVHCYLPPGHSIGTPQPLFQKIDPQRIQELKVKFAGTQAERKTDKSSKETAGPASKAPVDEALVQRLTREVTAQGDIVREAKSKKEAKTVIDAEVSKLLALKKQLSAALGEEEKGSDAGKKKKNKGGKKK